MTIVILARHGETDWNRDGIWQGHGDPPLNDVGRRQAEALAQRMRDAEIDVLYSSDLRRARETAEYVSLALGLPVIADMDLREVDVGSWTGLTWIEIAERFPDTEQHDGESREAFDARVLSALYRIASGNAGRRILVVTHGGVVRALQRRMLTEPLPVLGNCETYAVRHGADGFAGID